MTRSAATITPHSAMVSGLRMTTRSEVSIATAAPTSRSSSSGNDTTPTRKAAIANSRPTPLPTRIRLQPARVKSRSCDELADRLRIAVAEIRRVDGVRGRHPDQEDRRQQQAQRDDGADRGRAHHLERIDRRDLEAGLAPPAQLIETERGKRPDQREACRGREQQRHEGVAQRQGGRQNADRRIDHAQEHGVARHGAEVVPALLQRVGEIGRRNAADGGIGRAFACAHEDVRKCHCRTSLR